MSSSTLQLSYSSAWPVRPVYGFVLLDQYPLLPVSGMIDVLRDADYVTDRSNHQWLTIGADSREVIAMNGMKVLTDYTTADAPHCDVLVVCAGLGGHQIDNPGLFRWLRSRYAGRAMIGSVATGAWVLAKAGLLTNRRCTLHWEDISAFEESFPLLEVARTLFVRDGPIFTCSGGTAAIDLFLQFITENIGPEVSADVARQVLYQSARVGSETVPIKESPYRQVDHKQLRKAAQIMHDNLENPLSIGEIADTVGISQRQMERLFTDYFHTTPQLHYRSIRLDQARALVRLTKFEMWEIAIMVGFSSPQYLARCYRERFGTTPSQERKILKDFSLRASH